MRSSSLLAVLLLFAVVVRATVSAPPPSTVPNRTLPYPAPPRSPRGETMTLMQELLGSDAGRKRKLKAWDGRFLTAFNYKVFPAVWHGWRTYEQYWYFEQINDREVALRSAHYGQYVGHSYSDHCNFASVAKEWEMLTPVKNDYDGSWSFKSRWGMYLTAHVSAQRNDCYFVKRNGRDQRWLLD